ncbi:MAG: CDP-alcohol phosphatidyltransferase family protein [Acutalibacteraceae bacterium]|nr:CDP-alcohol phosphatidyltransferase family protein [Acutalibacteraceae bacterium]
MTTDSTNTYQKKIITIPNMLSFFRLCLIPVIVWLYTVKQDHFLTLIILALSGVTDIVDGIIARKCNMISDFGKAFDPVADKLTQMAMLFCLVSRFPYMMIPFVLLVVKEVFTGITALITIKRTNTVKGAVWHGKLTTVALYSMMAIHLLWYNIPRAVSLILVGICIGIMLMSFILYAIQNIKVIKNKTFEE